MEISEQSRNLHFTVLRRHNQLRKAIRRILADYVEWDAKVKIDTELDRIEQNYLDAVAIHLGIKTKKERRK